MKAKINSINKKDINVTFTFDDSTTLTTTIAIVPYATNSVDENGKDIIVMVDPSEDMQIFLKNWGEAYTTGKAIEKDQNESIDQNFVGQTFNF